MMNLYIKVEKQEHITPVINFFMAQGCRHQHLDLVRINIDHHFESFGYVYIYANCHMEIMFSDYPPEDCEEIIPEYEMAYQVVNHRVQKRTVTVEGKTYYRSDILNAIKGVKPCA